MSIIMKKKNISYICHNNIGNMPLKTDYLIQLNIISVRGSAVIVYVLIE